MPNHCARTLLACALPGLFSLAASAAEPGWSGHAAAEYLWFNEDALDARQHNDYPSLAFEPEYYREWLDGKRAFTFVPFVRLDAHDGDRTHFDVREALYTHVGEGWEVKAGMGKVFWGVTEAAHLVDIVNQTDLTEDDDGEDKLGQTMIRLGLTRDYGTFDFFVLPGYRERTFPDVEGRPRFGLPMADHTPFVVPVHDMDNLDVAARWSRTFGEFDIGLSHFSGVSREPTHRVVLAGATPVALDPRYDAIHQTGLDAQWTHGSWLWKFEGIRRVGQANQSFDAAAGGFEYTFYGIFGTPYDLGAILEYLYDERGDEVGGTFMASPFQRDVATGARLTFNDVDSSEILASLLSDAEGMGYIWNVEASRRIGQAWKVWLEWRGAFEIAPDSVVRTLRDDDHVRLAVERYF